MNLFRMIFLVGFCIAIATPASYCYNLEDRLPLFKFGKAGSSFGFSVAQHRLAKNKTAGVEGTVLVVGAPTAEASSSAFIEHTRPGGVYYCPVSTDPDDCKRIDLDITDEPPASPRIEIIKSGQWLGVSLRSQGPGEFLVTCAHRYRWQITSVQPNLEEEYVCGKCFLMKGTNSGDVIEISRLNATLTKDFISSPCDFLRSNGNEIYSKTRFGYTQAGSSLALSDSEYLLGGPGAWRWSGALFAIEMPQMKQANSLGEPTGEPTPPSQSSRVPNFYQSMTCPTSEWRHQPNKRKCNEFPLNRDSYMGFSVAVSDSILPNSNEIFYIAGAPRGNNSGAVVFLRKGQGYADNAELRPDDDNIVLGEATSSSFGYSVATADLNGDGLDDLIVGAPQYYEHSSKRKAGGAVYVYINEAGVGFSYIKPHVFYGPKNSHFGQTVAALGDIDQDGYGDFAVGAPYQEQNGAVHIYRGGSADSVVRKSQTIYGKDYAYISVLSKQSLVGFGASLSGLVDSDGNKYPDLLIGSFSDHVTLIRARPIIEVHMTFEVDRYEIDLDEKECDDAWSCFTITYCFEYKARHAEYRGAVNLSYKLTLDSTLQKTGKTARVVMTSSTGPSTIKRNVTLPAAGTRICPGKKLKALFLNQAEDRLSEIGVEIEHDLVIPKVRRERRGEPVHDMIKDPILDVDFNKTRREIVRIKNSCGADGCQSNLKFNATMPHEIVLGKTDRLPVKVTATNDMEEAHQASFTLTIPEDVTFSSTSTVTSRNITCGQVKSDLLLCEIGNPFKSGELVEVVVYFDVAGLHWEKKEIQLELEGYTTSENPPIVPIVLHAEIILELDIIVTGNGFPQQVQYKQEVILGELGMNETKQIGPLITFTFNAENRGTYTAPELSMSISLPSEIYNGKWLLYLVATEVTSVNGNTAGYCSDRNGNVNVLRLEPSYEDGGRSKRAAEILPVISTGSKNVFQAVLSCGVGASCIDVHCLLEELPPNDRISVKLYARLWEATFLEEKILRTLDLIHIDTTSHISTAFENVRLNTNVAEVRTTVDHAFFKDDLLSAFPWWYILIAVIVLLLIYVLIILLLIRCGFFKRKRYSRQRRVSESATQEQPVA